MPKPEYEEGSIVNLMASVAGAIGAPVADYAPLAALSPERLRRHRNVVLLLIDGLGHRFLARRPESRLFRHCEGVLTSVFPPTTAAAVTSFFTAVAPQQHAVTGWFTYLAEVDSVATVLPFVPRGGGTPYRERGLTPREVMGRGSMFESPAERACHVVTAGYLMDSEYSVATGGMAERHGYRNLFGLFDRVADLVTGGGESRYVFAYWPKLDALSHRHGVASPEVARHFDAVDAAFDGFLDRLGGTDTLVIAVADHGLVDTAPERTFRIEDHPDLAATLARPLCGDPRAAYCYVRPGRGADFEAAAREMLGTHGAVEPGAALVDAGYFGLGAPHPRLAGRVGDYVLLPDEGYCVTDRMAGETAFDQVGVHGGLSPDELYVPLVVVET